jgi:hypothetical protein
MGLPGGIMLAATVNNGWHVMSGCSVSANKWLVQGLWHISKRKWLAATALDALLFTHSLTLAKLAGDS